MPSMYDIECAVEEIVRCRQTKSAVVWRIICVIGRKRSYRSS
jgi:hypothetical protein